MSGERKPSATIARVLAAELAGDPDALAELRLLLSPGADEPGRLLTTREAADRLSVHPKTLTRAAAQGRVVGAVRVGAHAWRYRPADLALLPPRHDDPGPAGPGRGVRRPGSSSAAAAIRGDTTPRRAA